MHAVAAMATEVRGREGKGRAVIRRWSGLKTLNKSWACGGREGEEKQGGWVGREG